MKHEDIIESNLMDKYVLGKLAANQEEEFEAHFVDCPECVEQLKISRSFINDLKHLAVQEPFLPDSKPAAQSQQRHEQIAPRRVWWAVAWACVIVAVGFGFFAVRRLNRVEAELRQAKQNSEAISQKYQRSLETDAEAEQRGHETNQQLVQRLNELEQKLKTEGAPNNRERLLAGGSEAAEANFPIYALVSALRGQVPAPVEIALPASSSRFALSIPVEDRKDYSAYRVTILNHRGVTVFNRAGFKPDTYDALSLSLKSNFLASGTYDLRVEGLTPPNKWNTVGNYPFHITRRH